MLWRSHGITVGVHKLVWQAAHLGAHASVGAAPHGSESCLAVATVAYAERSVHEYLHRHIDGVGNSLYFSQRVFSRQHELGEAGFGKPCRLVGRADIALCAGVERYRRQVKPEVGHILNYECVDTGSVKLLYKARCFVKLVVVENGVHRHVDPRAVSVGELGERTYAVNAVCGSGACAECRRADIYGVGTGHNGYAACFGIFCRGKKFKSSQEWLIFC